MGDSVRKFSVQELRELAENDGAEYECKPWAYTDDCHECGGVKCFIDWLEEQVKQGGLGNAG